MDNWKEAQAAKASAAKALQAAFPKLVPVGGKVDGLNAAAKNIRIELKAAFPGVKFSVKSSRYSGGDSIDVRWEDGPVTEQVDKIISKYAGGSFNSSDDSYSYSADAWNDAFGDARYVSSNRDYSDKAVASVIRTVSAKYDGNLATRGLTLTVEDYRAGRYWNLDIMDSGTDYWSLQSIIGREAQRRTWSLTKVVASEEMEAS